MTKLLTGRLADARAVRPYNLKRRFYGVFIGAAAIFREKTLVSEKKKITLRLISIW